MSHYPGSMTLLVFQSSLAPMREFNAPRETRRIPTQRFQSSQAFDQYNSLSLRRDLRLSRILHEHEVLYPLLSFSLNSTYFWLHWLPMCCENLVLNVSPRPIRVIQQKEHSSLFYSRSSLEFWEGQWTR